MKRNTIFSHLRKFKVGIAGAGGLGSNCAIALARTGLGHLVISDFDIVSRGNLDRQYYFAHQLGMKKVDALKENIESIGFETIIEIHDIKLDKLTIKEIYKDCDIIVEAFDDAEMKHVLADTVLSAWPDKALVMGSGMAGYGKSELINERRLGNNLVVCGDEISEVSEENPPLAPRVGIVSHMQANAVVDILMNRK
jgi:sulfur carrier protein ThiS adenylyltransferase